MNSLILIFGLVIVVGMVLVIYGTVAENRWGINFSAVTSPVAKHPCLKSGIPGPCGRLFGVVTLARLAGLRSISGDAK